MLRESASAQKHNRSAWRGATAQKPVDRTHPGRRGPLVDELTVLTRQLEGEEHKMMKPWAPLQGRNPLSVDGSIPKPLRQESREQREQVQEAKWPESNKNENGLTM